MKLSTREKVLLIILGVAVIFIVAYTMVIKPQMERLESLKVEKEDVKMRVEAIDKQIASLPALNEKLEKTDKEVEELTGRFYPEIIQEKLIVLLDGLFDKTGLESDSNSFTQINIGNIPIIKDVLKEQNPAYRLVNEYKINTGKHEETDTEEDKVSPNEKSNGTDIKLQGDASLIVNSIESMDITVPFESDYFEMMDFMNKLKELERTVIIDNINITSTESKDNNEDIISGNMMISFYALPKIHIQDKEYLEWKYQNDYGTDNPFISNQMQ